MKRWVDLYVKLGFWAGGAAIVLGAFLLLAWLWRGEEAPEENWRPAAVCDVTVEHHPTHLRCVLRDGVASITCGAVGDRVDP